MLENPRIPFINSGAMVVVYLPRFAFGIDLLASIYFRLFFLVLGERLRIILRMLTLPILPGIYINTIASFQTLFFGEKVPYFYVTCDYAEKTGATSSMAVSRELKKQITMISTRLPIIHHHNFCHLENAVPRDLLFNSFRKLVQLYHEMPLPEYSRYKDWSRSCYMEVQEKWTPKTDVNEQLYMAMQEVLAIGKNEFSKWYCFKNNLEEVEVITLNSFVTKYIPVIGKNEFGKHVDGVRIDGSLILSLPEELDLEQYTDGQIQAKIRERHDWPGLMVWDCVKSLKKCS